MSDIKAGQRWLSVASPGDVIFIHGPVEGAPDSWDVSTQTGARMMRTAEFILDGYELAAEDSG